MVLLKYDSLLSGCCVSRRWCTALWIPHIGTIYMILMRKRGLQWSLSLCKGCFGGWCLSSTITIPIVWCIGRAANVRTISRCPSMVDSASSTTQRHFNHAGLCPAVDLTLLSRLVPIQRSTVSFLGGLCFLHLVDPVQWTILTACWSQWKDIPGIATVLYPNYFTSLGWLQYWLWLT